MQKLGGVIVSLIYFLITSQAWGQRQNNWWYFNNAAVNFNSGVPVSVGGSAMMAIDGCASVADSNTGNLLFYTNGVNVWNRNNQVMPNGAGLRGGSPFLTTSTTAALIVPKPGNPNQYYVFTADEQSNSSQLHYNVVDMSLAGGLGDVVAGQKNLLLSSNSSEKLAYAPHADGRSFWLLAHQPSGNGWMAFRIDTLGVNQTPVTSSAGTSLSNAAGCMKFSLDGKYIASIYVMGAVDVLDFNNQTGVVSNARTFPIPLGNSIYGVEFSPSGRYLYVSNITEAIYQFDLQNPSVSRQTVALTNALALQLGPDCKIYFANGGLGVINHPDSPAASCGFQASALTLATGTSSMNGLPMRVFFLEQVTPPVLRLSDSCAGKSSALVLLGNRPYQNLRWNFGDPSSGSNNSAFTAQPVPVNHTFVRPGKYLVKVVYQVGCVIDSVSDSLTIVDCTPVVVPCFGTISYRDSCLENGTSFSVISDSLILQVSWDFGDQASGNANFSNDLLPVHLFSDTGKFNITAYVEFRCGRDTLQTELEVVRCKIPIDTNQCELLIPNVITTNGDQLNDAFKVLFPFCEFESFNIQVYNRWGQEVFTSTIPDFIWNESRELEGSYFYLLQAKTKAGLIFNRRGFISFLK